MVLARVLPEHLPRQSKGRATRALLFKIGSNNHFLVPPGGVGPDLRRIVRLGSRLRLPVARIRS
jgi:hypothetical protein